MSLFAGATNAEMEHRQFVFRATRLFPESTIASRFTYTGFRELFFARLQTLRRGLTNADRWRVGVELANTLFQREAPFTDFAARLLSELAHHTPLLGPDVWPAPLPIDPDHWPEPLRITFTGDPFDYAVPLWSCLPAALKAQVQAQGR